MFWVTKGSQDYLYSTHRVGSKVEKRYHGRGIAAYALWIECQSISRKRDKNRKLAIEEAAKDWTLDQKMKLVQEAAQQAIETAYLGTNHYKSACHHWRRLPGGIDSMDRKQAADSMEPSADETPAVTSEVSPRKLHPRSQAIVDTIAAVKAGHKEQRSELRRLLLESDPQVWKQCADVFRAAADQWAARISDGNTLIREAILVNANQEREELAPEGSSAVQRVLADRLILSKLRTQCLELQVAANGSDPDVISSRLGKELTRQLEVANRELLEATRHYEKAKQLKASVLPDRPSVGAVALKVFNPEPQKRASA